MSNPNFLLVSGSSQSQANTTYTKGSETSYGTDNTAPAQITYSAGVWSIVWLGSAIATRTDTSPVGSYTNGATVSLREVIDWGTVIVTGAGTSAINGTYTPVGIESGRTRYSNGTYYLVAASSGASYGWTFSAGPPVYACLTFDVTKKCTEVTYSVFSGQPPAPTLSGSGSSSYNQVLTYNVTVTTGDGGTTNKTGVNVVNDGDTFTVTFTGNTGYRIATCTINGVDITAALEQEAYEYTTPPITSNTTIVVTWADEPTYLAVV